jgi:L-fucose mutarotase/ribose pyranase (RbsD/FucU family)
MPPLKGIDPGLNGEALKALEESGHGDQIVIVDPSYSIPEGATVIDYQGKSSASALRGILALVPHENNGAFDIVCMRADEGTAEAERDFGEVARSMGLLLGHQRRMADPLDPVVDPGFYANANSPEKRTIFFRTRDTKAYACARFTVGHSQE